MNGHRHLLLVDSIILILPLIFDRWLWSCSISWWAIRAWKANNTWQGDCRNHIIYQDSTLLVTVVSFAELVQTGLLGVWAEEHAWNTWFLHRPARKESKVLKLKSSQGPLHVVWQVSFGCWITSYISRWQKFYKSV